MSEPRFYNTSRWQSIRANFKATNPLCVKCQAEGVTKIATQVDHIIPIAEGGNASDWNNLQGLCDTHHSRKTRQENAPEKKPQGATLEFNDAIVLPKVDDASNQIKKGKKNINKTNE